MKSRDRRKIKGIELGFENVTGQFIPYEYIVVMYYSGIRTSIERPWAWKDKLLEMKSCERFGVRLSSKMKDMKYDFFKGNEYLDEDITVFERIMRSHDLVSVALVYKDGTKENFYIPWEDENGNKYRNGLLTIEFEDGDMLIEAKRE